MALALLLLVWASPARAGEPGYSNQVLADNPWGYWKFDETANPLADSSGNGNTFNTAGGATAGSTGTMGKAVHITGGNSYAGAYGSPLVHDNSVEMWMRTGDSQQPQNAGVGLFYMGDVLGNTNNNWLRFSSDGRLEIFNSAIPGSAVGGPFGPRIDDGSWHHLVVTQDFNAQRIVAYVDGNAVGTVAATRTIDHIGTAGFFWGFGDVVGSGHNPDYYVDGAAFYTHVLSPERVRSHLDQTAPTLSASHTGFTPGAWFDNASIASTITGNDSDTGVDYAKLTLPHSAPTHDFASCGGTTGVACPHSASTTFNYSEADLDEGTNTVAAQVFDAAGNASSVATWAAKLDRSPPSITSTSGPLSVSGAWFGNGATPTLSVTSSDAFAGVRSNELDVSAADDAFGRTTSSGWGTADGGGGWTVNEGPASDFSTNGSAGVISEPGSTAMRSATLLSPSVQDVDVTGRIKMVQPTSGAGMGSFAYLTGRRQAAGAAYKVGLIGTEGGNLLLQAVNQSGTAVFTVNTGFGFTPGTWYRLRMQVEGSPLTTVRAKAWRDGDPEPADWQATGQDSVGPMVAGGVGVRAGGGSTSAQQYWYDDLFASDIRQQQVKSNNDVSPCSTSSQCPSTLTSSGFTWNTSSYVEGAHKALVRARDPLAYVAGDETDHTTSSSWPVNVDRTPPSVDPNETGAMAAKGGWIKDGNLDLNASASDPMSGVAKLELFVDGVLKGSQPGTCAAKCGSPLATTFHWTSTGYTNPTPQVRVKATDLAGNPPASDFSAPATDTWTLKIDRTNPSATVSGSLKDGKDQVLSGGPYQVQVSANDGSIQTPSSGVASIELQVNDTTRDSCSQSTPGDNAPLSCTLTLTPGSADEGKRKIGVVVKDRVGNSYVEPAWYVIFDHTNPQITGLTHTGLPAGWAESANATVKVDARDDESGVKKIDLYTPSTSSTMTPDLQAWDAGCVGTVPSPCAQAASHTFSYGPSLPEGDNRVFTHAEDAATPAHVSTPDRDWHVKLDSSSPSLTLSGSLTTVGTAPIVAGSYDLQMDATDGDRSAPANERSGVKSLAVMVRREDSSGTTQFKRAYRDEQTCPEGSCAMSRNWVFRRGAYAEGTYTVRVVASDQLGHTTTKHVTVRVGPADLDPRDALGLEDYWQYQTTPTGAGTAAHVNLANGNLVWHSIPVVNPGRGLSTVANVTYNSQQRTEDSTQVLSGAAASDYNQVGVGFSLGIAGLTRVNEPLDVSLAATHGPIYLTDPDGTRHRFDPSGQGDWYIHPPGFDVFLRRYSASLLPDGTGATQPLKAWAATRPDGVTYFFDTAGYPTSIQDRNGNVIRFDYEYLSVTEPDKPCAVDAPMVGTPLASDVCRRRLRRVVDAHGVNNDPSAYDAGEPGENATVRDQRSLYVCYNPDVVEDSTGVPSTGTIRRLKDHAGRITAFKYAFENYLTDMTEAQGPTSSESSEGDCAYTGPSSQIAAPRTFHFDYEPVELTQDQQGITAKRNLIAVTDPQHAGGATADSDGKTVFQYEPRNAALQNQASSDPQSTTAYQRRRVLSVRDRDGYQTQLGYADSTNATGPKTHNASVTDPRGSSSSYTTDDRGRPVDIVEPHGAGPTATAAETAVEWDDATLADNKVVRLTEAAGAATGTVVTNMAYNQNGQLTDRYLQDDPSNHHVHIDYTYGEGNRVAPTGVDAGKRFVSDVSDIRSPRTYADGCSNCSTHFDRDDRGNVTAESDAAGRAITHYELAHHQIDYEIDQSGNKTTYSDWDPNGLPQTMVDARGNAGEGGSHTWHFYYDAVGNVIGKTDPRGTGQPNVTPNQNAPFTTTLTYDQLDRVRVIRTPTDSRNGVWATRRMDYDVNDNLTTFTDATTAQTHYAYTAMDRLARTDSPPTAHEGATGAESEVTKYSYDPNGNVESVDSPNGARTGLSGDSSTRYVYDQANQPIGAIKRSVVAGKPEEDLLTTYSYDLRGNLTGIGDPQHNKGFVGSPATFDADVSNWSAPLRFRYEYDDADERTDAYEDPAGLGLHTQYGYDANGNLRTVTNPRGDQTTYTYDAADRMTDSTDGVGGHEHRELRPDGRVDTLTKPNGTATSAAGDFELKYTYYPTGEVKQVTLPRADDQYGPQLNVSYTRDAVGNAQTITDPRGNTITNTFLDTGDLKTTDRPSWWRYAGGATSDQDGRDVQERGVPGFAGADSEAGDDGPDAQGTGDSQPPDTTPPGDLGSVDPEPMPDLIPKKGSTTFDYDPEMRLRSVTDAAGKATTLGRDAVGRVTQVTRPFKSAEPIVTSQRYDYDGNLVRAVDPRGYGNDVDEFSTLYGYDQFGRHVSTQAPGSTSTPTKETTNYGYDLNGNLTSVQLPSGTKTWTRSYDAVDRLTRSADGAGDTTTYAYDAAGNRTGERSPRGNPSNCKVDGTGTPCPAISLVKPTCTNPTAATPASWCFETHRSFDGAGRVTSELNGIDKTTSYQYDKDGNVVETAAPGSVAAPGQPAAPQVTTQKYDGRDLPWRTTTVGDRSRTTVTEYDGNGNLRREVNPAGVTNGLPERPDAPQAKQTTDYRTTADQQDAQVKDASYEATVREYDENNILTAVHEPWGDGDNQRWRVDYEPDSLGRTAKITVPYRWADGGTRDSASTYTYFDNGWTHTSTDGGPTDTVTYDYDDTGHQIVWQTPKRKIDRHFWPSGLLQTRVATGSDAKAQRYEYGYTTDRTLARIDWSRNNNSTIDRTTKISYDAANRQTAIDNTDNDDSSTVPFEKDTVNDYFPDSTVRSRLTDGSGTTLAGYSTNRTTSTFAYDPLGQELSTTVTRPNSTPHTFETTYYDSGQRASVTKRNGTALRATENFYYESDGRPSRKERRDAAGTLDGTSTTDYDYNENGDRTQDERGTYTYNARSQVTSWTNKDGTLATTYTVDGAGNVLQKDERAPGGSGSLGTTYTYEAGRLKTAVTAGSLCSRTETYTYGDLSKLTQIHGSDTCGGTASDVTYDYDGFDRLVYANSPGTDPQSYAYDGLDRRDQKCKGPGATKPTGPGDLSCASTEKTTYDYIGTSHTLATETNPTQSRTYDTSSDGAPLGYRQDTSNVGSKYLSYDTDVQGTITGLEQPGGAINDADRYKYDPFGALQSLNQGPFDPTRPGDPNADPDDANSGYSADARSNPLRFQGFYYDSGVKLYDMQAREYRPQVGRFLQADRFESASADLRLESDPLTQNRFAFAGGNPVGNIEWDGHEPITSFTNPCDNTFGNPTACHRRGSHWQQRRSAQRRRQFNFAVSNNWAEGKRSSAAADRKQANQLANASSFRTWQPRSDVQSGALPAYGKHKGDFVHRDDKDFGDYLANDLGGDLKGNFGTDLGIGDPESKTYQEGAEFYSRPEIQAAMTFLPGLGQAGKLAKIARAGRVLGKGVSIADKASELRALAGRNRVSIDTPNGRLSVDLEGRGHYEKTLGRSVDTPHVKFETRHVGADGRVSYTSGPVRDATHADLRLVARVLAERER